MFKRIYKIFIHILALFGAYALVSPRLRTAHPVERPKTVEKPAQEPKPAPTYPLLRLYEQDPLLRWLRDNLRLSKTLVIVVVVTFAAVCNLVIGYFASTVHEGSGPSIRDREYQLFLFVCDFIVTPVMFYLYLSQPESIAKAFKGLERNEVIGDAKLGAPREVKSYLDYRAKIQSVMAKWWWAALALAGTLGLWLVEWRFVWPVQFAHSGESFWFAVKWYLPIHLLSLSPAVYALCMFVLRQILAALYFNRLFRWLEVNLHPMHPDDSGGLGPLGAFTAASTLFAVMLGGVAMVVFLTVFLTRQDSLRTYLRPDTIIFLGLYTFLAPACLLLPMWSAHEGMVETRDEELQKVAQEMNKLLRESQRSIHEPKLLESAMEDLSKLQSQYESILRIYPTWPIPTQVFRNVSITATLPVLSGLVPVVIRIVSGD